MHRFQNLPTRKSKVPIECIYKEKIYTYQVFAGKATICEISSMGVMIASDIADAITFARDAGYKQALAEIRHALGIKSC